MYFELKILRADNGFITEFWEEGNENVEAIKTQNVFEEGDDEFSSVECFARLLWSITDHYGMIGSKHDKRRIRITTGGEDE